MPKFQSLRITKYTQPTIANKSKVTLPTTNISLFKIPGWNQDDFPFDLGPLLGDNVNFQGVTMSPLHHHPPQNVTW